MSDPVQSSNSTPDLIAERCDELKRTLIDKNRLYGDSATKAPIMAPWLRPQDAILARMSDKVQRIAHLAGQDTPDYQGDDLGESLDDSLLDLAGYSILLLVHRHKVEASQADKQPQLGKPANKSK